MGLTPQGPARQRTTLSWQRTALDFAVIGGLLLRAAGGVRNPLRLIPAGIAMGTAAVMLVGLRLGSRHGGRHPGRRAVYALAGLAIALQVLAGLLIVPL